MARPKEIEIKTFINIPIKIDFLLSINFTKASSGLLVSYKNGVTLMGKVNFDSKELTNCK